MPDRYFLTTPENDIAMHFDLMRALGDRLTGLPPSPFSASANSANSWS